ncbi:Cyclin-A1-1 [Forsythia ovata]|uniref:Cyclin-A1-1 n=1 Tax=Forsythia ovata TaxID=205694 RepID=A0ABD1U4S1_9LAMI
MASSAGGGRKATSSSKRHAASSLTAENLGKVKSVAVASCQHGAKKRPALANVTNQQRGSFYPGRSSLSESYKIVPCTEKIVSTKASSSYKNANILGTTLPASSLVKPSIVASSKNATLPKSDIVSKILASPTPSSMDTSPDQSDVESVSMDESMSTRDLLKSPEVEYIDNNEVEADESIEGKVSNMLCISEPVEISGNICKEDVFAPMESNNKIIDLDDNLDDPQLCATIACDIYKHLRASEAKKRPATDFMRRVQKDINSSMRAILIDWLVEVTEEYRLVPETLYLTVNYIDRYLSGNVMDRQRLQLLGVACMMIAS